MAEADASADDADDADDIDVRRDLMKVRKLPQDVDWQKWWLLEGKMWNVFNRWPVGQDL